jgi:8-oxo-dGTP diphosphatase
MSKPVTPLLTVDCVIVDRKDRVLLIKRGHPPFQDHYALPGGFVDLNETVEGACLREVLEETNLTVRRPKLVGIYSEPGRDPRGPTVSIAYVTRIAAAKATAGDDASAVEWVDDWKKLPLAFDHKTIIKDALKTLGAAKK